MNTTLSSEQQAALEAFASRNGRIWKNKLRDIWMTGRYSRDDDSAGLQQVRQPVWSVVASKLQTPQI